jgi:hypothetical protein
MIPKATRAKDAPGTARFPAALAPVCFVGVAEVGVAVVLSALEELTTVKLVKVTRLLAVLVPVLDAAAEGGTSDELAVIKAVVEADSETGGERETG